MTWDEVLKEPALRGLPYKIELNEYGQVVMSPISNLHGLQQAHIAFLLNQQAPGGEILFECCVDTKKGVKVADIAWLSDAFFTRHGFCTPYPQAPEICVEVALPSISPKAPEAKRRLYFQQGAKEVWICDASGNLKFFDLTGIMPASILCPDFPSHV